METTQTTQTLPTIQKATKLPLAKRYKKDEITLAIGRNRGIKSAICRDLDCTMAQLTHYLNLHSELKPLLNEAKKEIISLAEEKLLQNLNSADEGIRQRAIEFILKTLGKSEYSTEPTTQINVNAGDAQVQIQQLFGI